MEYFKNLWLPFDQNAVFRLMEPLVNFNRMQKFIKRYKLGTLVHIYPEKVIKQLREEIEQLQSLIRKQLPDLSKPVRATQIANLVDLQVLLGDGNWYDCEVEIKEQRNGCPTAYGWIYLPKEQEQLWLKDTDYSDWNGQSVDADMIECPFTNKLVYLQVRFMVIDTSFVDQKVIDHFS